MGDILFETLRSAPQSFLQPTLPLYTDALAYLKHTLDPLAAEISSVRQTRLRENRKKRKRGERDSGDDVLKIKQIHTEGFTVEQVWEQASRVLDAARSEAERALDNAVAQGMVQADSLQRGDVLGHDLEDEDDMKDESAGSEDLDLDGEDQENEGVDWEDDDELEQENAQEILEDDEDIHMGEDDDFMDEDVIGNDQPPDEFVADKFGLNDGFFSIDDFNRRSDFLEQQDARGEDDGAASDEEDVDWDADPLAGLDPAANSAISKTLESDEEDDEDGPTFGDPDAMSEDDDDGVDGGEMDAMGGLSNTNHVMYADFFAPPAQRKRKTKSGRPNPHNFPADDQPRAAKDDDGDDMERTMAAVHRDLFNDDESDEETDEGKQSADPSDPKSRRSTHERRKAALAEEIRKLEAANVAKREWTLSGEARAVDRPMNSLLEEDLDFERAGKPVPVITAEVSESIEDLIKRRILAHDFQDIIRRRPDDLATGKDGKRGRLDIQLDDNKSKKGLAEEYEEEHLRRTDPNFVDVKDEKLKKEEKEIEALWKKVSSDLDSLSSWHFRPKQPIPQLDIRVDAPAISMEDARPSAGGEVAAASQLAPQEVYRAGEAAKGTAEEIVGKSGLPSGKEEMSREERKRRRRREKERIRKGNVNEPTHNVSKAAKEKKDMLGELKKGDVRVIGKKGDVKNLDGREVQNHANGIQGAGKYKL